jgi:hypothetical protein
MNKLIEAIGQVLENQQLNLVLTEDGYDWCPKDNTWGSEYLSLLDSEGIRMRWEDEPRAEDVADWVRANVAEWVTSTIYDQERYGDDLDRLAFLKGLLEKL